MLCLHNEDIRTPPRISIILREMSSTVDERGEYNYICLLWLVLLVLA